MRLAHLSAIAASSGLLLISSFPGCSDETRAAEKTYQQFCMSCHGENLTGGIAPTMLDDVRTHGGTDEAITEQIITGDPAAGMPAFGEVFSDAEVRALVVYIREQRSKHALNPPAPPKPDANQIVTTSHHNFRVEVVTDGVDTPWGINWLPDGTLLITEKSGDLRLWHGGILSDPIDGTPDVDALSQAGLFDAVAHPNHAENGWIYLSFADIQTKLSGSRLSLTKIVRGRIKDGNWIDQETIYEGPIDHYRKAGGYHFGSRIAFDDAGYIFFTIGDRGNQTQAQDLTLPHGKVHRLFDDGRVPPDNPFVNQTGAVASIWSYGHRNPQGMDFDPRDGKLWATEHGPRGGDELNLVRPKLNYGWPEITYGMNYNGTPITGETAREGMEQPGLHWTPSIAVCGIDFYDGTQFPEWTGNLLVGALAKKQLRRVEIENGQIISQEILLQDAGRVRDVSSGPDGLIYLALNGSDRIVRLVPVD
ncbi:MAG: glucose sorbosone dehydrogenase [Opitutaceae bacterium]|nr:glucose sorbosone dehydrogenase [Opitutaceae bacterium]